MVVHALLTAAHDVVAVVLPQFTVPDPAPVAPTTGVADKAALLVSWLKWGGLVVIFIGFLIAAILLGYGSRHGEGRDVLMRFIKPLGGGVLIGAAASIVGAVVN